MLGMQVRVEELGHMGRAVPGEAGDLSVLERQMLRNLLHFSELDAADVCIPRGQIIALAGCDLLTISPSLLAELAASTDPLVKKLDAAAAQGMNIAKRTYDEKTFRYEMNDDAMATEKTAEGIRKFAVDIVKLESLVSSKLG